MPTTGPEANTVFSLHYIYLITLITFKKKNKIKIKMLTVGSKAGYQTTHSGYIIYIYTPVGKWTLNIDDLSVLLKYIVRLYFYKFYTFTQI